MTVQAKVLGVDKNSIFVTIKDSSVIKAVSYEKKLKRLNVTFSNGNVYTYSGVSYARFNNLVNNESVGKYFAKNIKGKYLSEKRSFVLTNEFVHSLSRSFS